MNSSELIKKFKSRLLSTNKRSTIFFNGFYKGTNSINLKKIESLGIICNLKGAKITLKEALTLGNFKINFALAKDLDEKHQKHLRDLQIDLTKMYKRGRLLNEERNISPYYFGSYFVEGQIDERNDSDYFRTPLLFQQMSIIGRGSTF